MRVAIIAERTGPQRRVDSDLATALRWWGCQVDLLTPRRLLDRRLHRWTYDLTVNRSLSRIAQTFVERLHHLGETVVNPYPVLLTCSDQGRAERTLHEAGLPARISGRDRSAGAALRRHRLTLVGDTVSVGPVAFSSELRDLVMASAAAIGTDLLGIDVIIGAGKASIVEVTAVPDLADLPDAGLRLAEYVYAAAWTHPPVLLAAS